jgi:uncharacterized tellurite resistance protein B-like protein
MLLKKLKDLLGSESTATGEVEHRALELACAALMFEVARADFTVETTEQDAVTSLLTEQFNLSADEVSTITEAAVEQADAATCLFEFTRTLNELASAEQKRDLLAMMWRVAMADNEISRYEEHVIRKVADLLYVPHSDFIAAKQSAM